jgi:hypothetical protein
VKPIPLHPFKPLRSSAPPTSILNPRFAYVPSGHTDLAKTFARIKQAQAPKTLDPETEARR